MFPVSEGAYIKRDCTCPRLQHRHGTRTHYQYHECRCLPCRAANARGRTAYARGESFMEGYKVPAVGTQRRLQALNAVGHTWTYLAQRLGVRLQSVREIAGLSKHHQYQYTYADTAQQVHDLYEELWNVQPIGTAALRARLAASRKGFLPPLAWDEDSIDDPSAEPSLLALDPSGLPFEARLLLAEQLINLGYKLHPACKRAQVDPRAFKKYRKEAA